MNPIDIIAQAVRSGRTTAAGSVAEEIVGALDKADFVIVPKVPTREQLDATNQPDSRATEVYQAMIAAGAAKPE